MLGSKVPAASTYLAAREALIADERSLRRDFKELAFASTDELHADQIIRTLKQEEVAKLWSIEHPEVSNVFPGMEFLSARSLIMETRVFKALSKMPKGALLHSHLCSMVNPAVLLRLAMEQRAIHIRVPIPLTPESLNCTLPEFGAIPPSEYNNQTSITSASYLPGTWVSISSARENFSSTLGGPTGFDKWATSAMMINPKDAYETHNTVKKIWEKFQITLDIIEKITDYMPIWIRYVKEFFLSSIEDGISFIETRVMFYSKHLLDADCGSTVTHRDCCLAFDKVIKEVKAELALQGRKDEFIGARIIYSTMRFVTCEELDWYLNDCIQLKQEFPHLIAGFDLVGSEDGLRPLLYYVEPLLTFKARIKELGLDVPFIFHAGETLGDGSEADNNLYDSILLGTKRIGHGFSLAKHPKLMKLCKEKGIAIEVCPISNEILRLTSSMCTHPLPVLINNGVPVALCSDDPAVFGNMGLTYDFFQVLMASDINGLRTLGMIAKQSLEFSTLGDKEKSNAILAWDRQWKEFITSIVDGTIFDSDR